APNQWGGISFEADLDKNDGRFNFEDRGIFLNYVNNADIRFGGGSAKTATGSVIVAPLQMIQTRPTISFNNLTLNAGAALTADPDSFEETNFNAPKYQISAVSPGPD